MEKERLREKKKRTIKRGDRPELVTSKEGARNTSRREESFTMKRWRECLRWRER